MRKMCEIDIHNGRHSDNHRRRNTNDGETSLCGRQLETLANFDGLSVPVELALVINPKAV